MMKGAFQMPPVVKTPRAIAGDTRFMDSVPGSGRSPGVGSDNLFQYSCLENPLEGGAWRARVHGVAKSQTRLNASFTFNTFQPSAY